jgi:hypothetical protein
MNTSKHGRQIPRDGLRHLEIWETLEGHEKVIGPARSKDPAVETAMKRRREDLEKIDDTNETQRASYR